MSNYCWRSCIFFWFYRLKIKPSLLSICCRYPYQVIYLFSGCERIIEHTIYAYILYSLHYVRVITPYIFHSFYRNSWRICCYLQSDIFIKIEIRSFAEFTNLIRCTKNFFIPVWIHCRYVWFLIRSSWLLCGKF